MARPHDGDCRIEVRLRRWTGLFFAATALNHVWYMPIFFLSSSEDIMMTDLIGGLLDSMTVFPLAIIILFIIAGHSQGSAMTSLVLQRYLCTSDRKPWIARGRRGKPNC